MWVAPSGLLRGVRVGRGGGPMEYGHVSWVCIGYLRVGCGGVGGKVEAVCCRGWIPRIASKYIELVGVCSMGVDSTCFTSVIGSARR